MMGFQQTPRAVPAQQRRSTLVPLHRIRPLDIALRSDLPLRRPERALRRPRGSAIRNRSGPPRPDGAEIRDKP